MERIIKQIQKNENVLLCINQRIKELREENLKLSATSRYRWENILRINELTKVKFMVLGEQ